MTTNKKITSNDNTNDFNSKLVLTAGILLLGAFFVMNPSSLNVFADVEPGMLNFTSGSDDGVLHPGDVLTDNKTVIINTTSIGAPFNVTWNVYQEGTNQPCVDLLNSEIPVLNFTTLNQTNFLNEGNHTNLLNFTETFVGMPGVYHCTTVFEAVNATDSDFLGNQTVWIDAIGSKGYWKNHPDATDIHIGGIFLGPYEVMDSINATKIFKEHKGKYALDKLAGQLLAAKLNIAAIDNATKTDCIGGNVTAADVLLDSRDYNGPTNEKLTGKDKKPALDYHKYLDKFNNYGCPLED
jgi:hypothetical protein